MRELKRTLVCEHHIRVQSHPSRVRELKQDAFKALADWEVSHPSRVRELKREDCEEKGLTTSRTPPGCVN